MLKALYDSRQKIIHLLNNNSKTRSEAIYKSKQNETEGKGRKILTPKQMLQRLPISLAQVMKLGKLFILCINRNKLLKTYTIIKIKPINI